MPQFGEKEIQRIGVIGAGNMGAGIAQVAAMASYEVNVFDISSEQQKKAQNGISKSLEKLVSKGQLSESVQDVLARLKWTQTLEDLSNSHLVIEAATENREVKFRLFQDLDNIVDKRSLFASNTSSISITEIASHTSRPSQVAGMHFMNPVPLMRLVEGISGLATSKETFSTVRAVAEKMGKVFIEAKDSAGFVVNRILIPMINEGFFALQDGLASAADIDQAMKLGCNFPMGPLELADFVGLDVILFVAEILHRDLGEDKYRPSPLLRKYVEAGWLGRKTKRGVYEYA